MPGKVTASEETLRKLPSYVCMCCGAREHLAPVARPVPVGEEAWWVCRPGHGCALTAGGTAGKL